MMDFQHQQQQQQYESQRQEEESVLFIPNGGASNEIEISSSHHHHQNSSGNNTIEIVTAVAIPNTIRPPMIPSSANVHPSVLFAKRLGILCSGLFLAFISFFDAYVFLALNIFHRLSVQLAGIFWACSCLSLIVGSVLGCYHGKWRYLAPGIVLSHLASVWINLVMDV